MGIAPCHIMRQRGSAVDRLSCQGAQHSSASKEPALLQDLIYFSRKGHYRILSAATCYSIIMTPSRGKRRKKKQKKWMRRSATNLFLLLLGLESERDR